MALSSVGRMLVCLSSSESESVSVSALVLVLVQASHLLFLAWMMSVLRWMAAVFLSGTEYSRQLSFWSLEMESTSVSGREYLIAVVS
ncbi:hypothetical protein [Halocatena pleomorpha]|uniref:hypothetical protein n=1 Tax=Halocatena pleomorpha TaxID=1785090 RepID=UPI001C8A1364|nr:hypothetical protein [Halocatena pleomorpha]